MKKLLANAKSKAVVILALLIFAPIIITISCDEKECNDPTNPDCPNYVPPVIDDTIPDNPVDTTPDNPVEPKCDKEEADLAAAQAEEARINGDFTINADSCIYYWAPQISTAFMEGSWNTLHNVGTPPYTKRDSVYVLTSRANATLPIVPETDSRYLALKSVSRTGGNALTAWDLYVGAQATTQAAQTALTDCQNSR
ncbi:MAG TPA: hypothetical protein PLG05_04125 [Bacteroidales bacterium]|nr:hypothetical protein [Bacteroidales bacterium]HPL04341.1 hypothetical protein [Bacteroidales bacterium]